MTLRRRGAQHLVQQPVVEEREAHHSTLIEGMGHAFHWQRLLDTGEMDSHSAIARAEGLHQSVVNELLRLTLLAPDVVEALVGQPAITVEKVLGHPWPYGWREQARLPSSAPQSPPL